MISDEDGSEPVAKRRKLTGRRRAACQTCSLRKVKCDNARPECFACQTTGTKCVYVNEPDDSLTLNKAVEILTGQITGLAERLDTLVAIIPSRELNGEGATRDNRSISTREAADAAVNPADALFDEHPASSRDFSHIPPHKTTADEVLTWPIFENAFPAHYLIDPHLGYRLSTGGIFDEDTSIEDSILPSSGNVAPLDEHRIPALVDRFLENVHTKNPILDVEKLVAKSREAASKGLGWDGVSCLLLLACALGLVAKPFGSEQEALNEEITIQSARHIAAPHKEKAQADNCFIQASRRIGGLRPSITAAQCNFFAGVYLMYTLRPMLSWQYFHQASITYQLYLKMNGRVSEDDAVLMRPPLTSPSRRSRTARLEQRLYWSCFKSEAEFRIELPLPQSEIAVYDFPHLFPSPPSPPTNDVGPTQQLSPLMAQQRPAANMSISQMLSLQGDSEIKSHAKRLCNEEESWYYYLTEIALRRIGNRVINTFFQLDRRQWLEVDKLINVAIEFEAQVSTWKTNLPPAMQKYETNSTIRAPRIASPGGAETGFVSQELSWATENRLLEMRHWLYQPFLYYLIHTRPSFPTPTLHQTSSHPYTSASPASTASKEHNLFWQLIVRAIECNLTILDTRTLPHRHHGLWFDLRAIICSSLILIAVVKSGYEDLIPGGLRTLVGALEATHYHENSLRFPNADDVPTRSRPRIHGKFGRVLRQLEIWSEESPDMIRAREVLEGLILQILGSG